MQFNNDGWSVIYTKPNHERKVQKQLDFFKIRNYLPTVKVLTSRSCKKRCVSHVLFPSYIFAKPKDLPQYFDSLKIPGVIHYLRSENRIAEVNEAVINRLMFLNEKSDDSYLEISSEKIPKGEILNIQRGPFKGIACEVIQYKTSYKIVVRIELLKRNVIVQLTPDCLVC